MFGFPSVRRWFGRNGQGPAIPTDIEYEHIVDHNGIEFLDNKDNVPMRTGMLNQAIYIAGLPSVEFITDHLGNTVTEYTAP